MTNEELLSVAEIVERLVTRFHKQAADHEAKMVEHRASFGARTEADAKLIAGLRAERNGLLTQVQDMRVEMERYRAEMSEARSNACQFSETLDDASLRELEHIDRLVNPVVKRMLDQHRLIAREYDKALALCEAEEQTPEQCIVSLNDRIDRLQDDARAEAADREELYRINSELRAVIAALQERTPKQHPVKVGEYVKRMTGFNTTLAGEIGRVNRVDDDAAEIEYEVKRQNGETGVWCAKNCEPCDPPEATHDTKGGKAAAESALKTEPVAEEIKVGDLVEVVSNRGRNTWLVDVGSLGIVTSVEDINDSISVHLDDVPGKRNALAGYVSFCDVRKVTT